MGRPIVFVCAGRLPIFVVEQKKPLKLEENECAISVLSLSSLAFNFVDAILKF